MELPAAAVKQPDSLNAHCAGHTRFTVSCAVCRQARANLQPYPVRPSAPASRSFGFSDKLTPGTIGAMSSSGAQFGTAEDVEFSLSLAVIRFVLRLIWPFSRII